MPIYDLKCQDCKKVETNIFFHMHEKKERPCTCGGTQEKLFNRESIPKLGVIEIEPEFDYSTGQFVKPADRKEHCKRHNKLYGSDTEIDNECDVQKANQEAALNASIEKDMTKHAHLLYNKWNNEE